MGKQADIWALGICALQLLAYMPKSNKFLEFQKVLRDQGIMDKNEQRAYLVRNVARGVIAQKDKEMWHELLEKYVQELSANGNFPKTMEIVRVIYKNQF